MIAKEPSTWAGVSAVLASAQIFVQSPRATSDWCALAVGIVSGIAAVFMRESPSPSHSPPSPPSPPSVTVVNANVAGVKNDC